jgi:microcystin-dependent protein
MTTLTDRLKLPVPGPDDLADGPADFTGVCTILDAAALDLHGTTAQRPAPTTVGQLWTDDQTGVTSRANGTSWVPLNPVLIAVGTGAPFFGAAAPAGWLICDGRSLTRVDYPDLFAAIGTAYGAADSTHFNLPDCRGTTLLGAGQAPGLSPRAIGARGGAEQVALSLAQSPAHAHTGQTDAQGAHSHGGATGADSPDHAHTTNVGLWARNSGNFNTGTQHPFFWDEVGGFQSASGGASARHAHGIGVDGSHAHNFGTSSQGGGAAHENMPPFLVINWIIRALP